MVNCAGFCCRFLMILRYLDLDFDVFGVTLGKSVESLLGLLHRIGPGNEWFKLDLAGGHHVYCFLIDVGVAEYVFDSSLARLDFRDVHGYLSVGRNANDNSGVARSSQSPKIIVGLKVS